MNLIYPRSHSLIVGEVYEELAQAWEELTSEGSQFELEAVNVEGVDLLL